MPLNIPESMSESDVLTLASQIMENRLRYDDRVELRAPEDAQKFIMFKLAELEREVFGCLFLDVRQRLIAYEELFQGTLDGASVYPREVAKTALKHNAAKVIFCHNHPSGDPEPSHADKHITQRLHDALDLLGIDVIDHIVVGGDQAVSFADRGWMY